MRLGDPSNSGNFSNDQGEAMTQTAVIDLGPGNVGAFGPAPGTPEEECVRLAETACDDAYNKPATMRYICVDGRFLVEEKEQFEAGLRPESVDKQLAGGKVISESAAGFMDDPSTHKPQSVVLAESTKRDVEDGFIITVHGDDVKDEEGCAAHVREAEVLTFNAENADIVAPVTWTVAQALEIDHLVSQDDIAVSIMNGQQAADNKALWDVTAKEAVAIMKANGAQYVKCVGSHKELGERVDFTEGGFDKVGYGLDHSTDTDIAMVFSASLGAYKKDCFEQTLKHGGTERDAALKLMRVALFNIGASKVLMPENAKVGLVLPAR